MPPVLDPSTSKVDGLAFLGLSLSRKSKRGHAESSTHQQSFDLDLLQDRDYEHVFSTSDDGWLAGGGEPGPPHSYKLAAKDSAHVEIMRIGTYREDWGGIPREFVIETLRKGQILIPEITVVPTAVVANRDKPPEIEIRFDMIPNVPNFDDLSAPLPLNWQLRFIQNQLFHKFKFASRFTPGAFHSTIVRKAEFRSEADQQVYLNKCNAVCQKWIQRGVKPLVPSRDGLGSGVRVVKCVRREPKKIGGDDESRMDNEDEDDTEYYRSGLWLFTDRNNISHQFLPNFLPPYDTPIKKKLILVVLKEEWDEKKLKWKSHTTKFDPQDPPIPKPVPTKFDPQDPPIPRPVPEARPSLSSRTRSANPASRRSANPASPTIEKSEVTAPSQRQKSVRTNHPKQNSSLGMFDPNDDIGFTQFMSSFGTHMAEMTFDVCGPMLDQMNRQNVSIDNELGRNSVMEDEKDDDILDERDSSPKPVAIVTGQRLSQRSPIGAVIDVTKYSY